MKIYVEEKYTRAAPGGVGFSKNAGNYGASMLATALAKKQDMIKYCGQMLLSTSIYKKWVP
jgi:branched-chain amino acid aminotransferase